MMFELSVASKYLIPRWRQLSVSIITLVSTFVIALVVWLIVVFFSVKDGLENSWIDKIVALTAPVRLTPTEKYYQSYYYLADGISGNSDYTLKSIHEKWISSVSDPYDPELDEELPREWAGADRDADGSLKDPVKGAYQAALNLRQVKGIKVSDYEMSGANLHLQLQRSPLLHHVQGQVIDHAVYIGSFDGESRALATALLPLSSADFNNLLFMQSMPLEGEEDSEDRVRQFFDQVEVKSLKVSSKGWVIPKPLLPSKAKLTALAEMNGKEILKIIIPVDAPSDIKLKAAQNGEFKIEKGKLFIEQDKISFKRNDGYEEELPATTPLIVEKGAVLQAKIDRASLQHPGNSQFDVSVNLQGMTVAGKVRKAQLLIDKAEKAAGVSPTLFAFAREEGVLDMPMNSDAAEPVILPKNFKEAGALVGDRGYLSYLSPTPSTVQEQRIPIYVAGFYDPGIMPIGGKYILAGKELTSLIRSSLGMDDTLMSNGINVRFDSIKDAALVKKLLTQSLQNQGIADYWKVETYQEFDFTKDLLQQLRSEKNLFSLISLIIIIVACSNIISMLIILVNDKKGEIGILRSMGATSRSIALIFGLCGIVMGAIGSLVGIAAAVATLYYINELVGWISRIQGYDLFNPLFYGNSLPSELSLEALSFVMATTVLISLLAGIVPAVKASLVRPSMILRAE